MTEAAQRDDAIHTHKQVHLASDDPFDWESYISPYKGLARIQRLIHLASCCPELRQPCSAAALDLLKETTRDTSSYHHVLTLHNTDASGSLISAAERKQLDSEWLAQTEAHNRSEQEKLELELRNYQNNLIKESIRMAHRDLGDHFRSTGELQEALKSYTRTRDFCSTSEHVIEMCLNVVDVSLRLENYGNVQTFVSKAEGVLETYVPSGSGSGSSSSGRKLSSAATGSSSSGSIAPPTKGGTTAGADAIGALFRAGGSSAASTSQTGGNTGSTSGGSGGGSSSTAAEAAARRQVAEIAAKLKAAQALAALGLRRYESAARTLVSIDPTQATALGDYVSPSDVAIYVVLCSLATMERGPLKAQVLDQAGFRTFLEHEPHARELLDAFAAARFRKVGEILERWKSRHVVDPNLAPHMEAIHTALTRRALRQTFSPFDKISIARMASAFGWTEERMARELIGCVERGELKNLAGRSALGVSGEARIDWRAKTLEYHVADSRKKLFETAIKNGEKMDRENKRLLLRMKLVEHGIVVKAPPERERTGGQQAEA
ncbi:uncharacterized protein PFL1_01448 [Pseudozyma flocculosa PF-1]|uniref:Related to COP9 signalosome complex subunit 1 n=1 Tax=Pseudozyma flocculosa TaxID=84751 RepID=A0A5C3EVH0_9BASI|nr:uncharacterized protein PFL1_01448 [Pseudozyma flocculosa PF-1]EPQ31263.1 hypothetical protein PFL1_01448 [Pseudozyma flocculosa PF-1]SPO36238.1 related to COP9 signalosome complex subunit 1 [Pseudozyma flocculosa]